MVSGFSTDGDGDGEITAVSIWRWRWRWSNNRSLHINSQRPVLCQLCLPLCLSLSPSLSLSLSVCLLLTTSITCANKLQQTFAEDSPLPPTKRGKLLLHMWPASKLCFVPTVPTKCYPTHTHTHKYTQRPLSLTVCVHMFACCGIRNSMQMSLSHLGNSFENLPIHMTMRSSVPPTRVCVCVCV